MRTYARECVFKFLYARLFNPSDEGLFALLCKELNNDDKKFATDLLSAIDNGYDRYIAKIEELSIGFKLERLHRLDKCAILLGMAELENFKQTPIAVIIDEAVNMVAKYSTESSTSFVNGILAEFTKEI